MKIRVNSIFNTIQGEGFNAGTPATFLRLAHCNLDCSWCDTEFNTYTSYSLKELKDEFFKVGLQRLLVITGGEPFLNPKLFDIIYILPEDQKIAIETNGTLPPTKSFKEFFDQQKEGKIFITVSPKREQVDDKPPFYFDPVLITMASEIKIVVDKYLRNNSKVLLRLMDSTVKQTTGKPHLYLSPEYSEMKKNVSAIYNIFKNKVGWKLSLQTHKWAGLP